MKELITEVVIVCKRLTVDKGVEIFYIGELDINGNIEGPNITVLQWRQRYANNEKFYAMSKKNYENEIMREHIYNLISQNIESILYTYV